MEQSEELILEFISSQKLSGVGIEKLLNLIKQHIPKHNNFACSSKYFLQKKGLLKKGIERNGYMCQVCNNLMFSPLTECSVASCTGRTNNTIMFTMLDIESQLQNILQGNLHILNEQSAEKQKSITDITDGEFYREIYQQHIQGPDNKKKLISLIWSTDGAEVQKSNKAQAWPIFAAINELPINARFLRQNIILVSLWCDSKKPDHEVFKQYLSFMCAVFKDYTTKVNDKAFKVVPLVATFDMPARALVMNHIGPTGFFACSFCREPGCTQNVGKGHCRVWPMQITPDTDMRTHENVLEDATKAENGMKPIDAHGMHGITSLFDLEYFHGVHSVAIDYMHAAIENVFKTIMLYWFTPEYKTHESSVYKYIDTIDARLIQIKPPIYMCRVPRSIAQFFKQWKASEMRNFALYYILPCVAGLQSDNYIHHLAFFIGALHIYLRNQISEEDLQTADRYINTFTQKFDQLYPKTELKINVHTLLHLHDTVKRLGPLFGYSMFPFEDANFLLQSYITGPQHPTTQVCSKWLLQTMVKNRKNNEEEGETYLIDKVKILSPLRCTENRFWKIQVNGETIIGTGYTKLKRQDNSLIDTNDQLFYIIEYFTIEDNHVFAIAKVCDTEDNDFSKCLPHMFQIHIQHDKLVKIRANTICEVYVKVDINGKVYGMSMPNRVEKDM